MSATVRDYGFMPVLAYNESSAGKAGTTAQVGLACGLARSAVWQVRADDPGGTYRAVYVTQLEEAVYVLPAFQKKSTSGIATPQRELDLIRQRLQLARKLAGK